MQYSVDGVSYQSSGNFSGLSADNFTVIVRDAAGCTRGFPLTLVEPNALSIGRIIEQQPVSCNGCNDGILEVINSIGGIGTHTYSVNAVNFQTSPVFAGPSAGTYTVIVRDAAGCTFNTTATITQPAALVLTANSINLSCNGSNDGQIYLSVAGGNGRYMYQLAGTSVWQASSSFFDLAAGTYSVMVKDKKDCMASVITTITQPTPITASVITGTATCGGADGNTSVTAAGGAGAGYEYSIKGGVNFQATGSFSGLASGTYTVIVRDGSSCYNAFQVVINSTTGPAINTFSNTDVTCFNGSDGSISVSAAGGTGTLEYSIGGAYQSVGSFTGLAAGFYFVTVRDAVGCFASDTITLTQGNPIAVTASVNNNVACFGGNDGSVTVSAAGGIGTLAYSLNGTSYQSIGTFNGLSSGPLYITYVRDAGGCVNFTNFSISQPTQIIGNVGVLNSTCAGADNGSIFVNASGGTGALQYSLNGTNYGSASSWSNLESANYIIYVRDANNCTIGLLANVNEPAPIALSATLDDVNCAGGNDGFINLNVSGVIEPYAYAWSNGATRDDIFNLSAGTYAVIITDANGCTATDGYVISSPATPIIVNGTVANASGASVADGAIDITVTGGTAPYSYEWSNGSITQDLSNATPGFYFVIVTDANGCETSQFFNISFGSSVVENEIKDANILLYPNPAMDYTNVEIAGFNGKVIEQVTVIDALGRMIFTIQGNSDKVQLNTVDLSAGFYLIQVEVEGQRLTQKLNITK